MDAASGILSKLVRKSKVRVFPHLFGLDFLRALTVENIYSKVEVTFSFFCQFYGHFGSILVLDLDDENKICLKSIQNSKQPQIFRG